MNRSLVTKDELVSNFKTDFTSPSVENQEECTREFSSKLPKPILKQGEPRHLTLNFRSYFLKYFFSQQSMAKNPQIQVGKTIEKRVACFRATEILDLCCSDLIQNTKCRQKYINAEIFHNII